jgi:uncharacterized protein YndB with AHSA1/START domain
MAGDELQISTPGTDIVMTRSFAASRSLVFEAHTSCEHLSRWWGPRKYRIVECDLDFRPGGAWRVVQEGPEGYRIAFFGEYREIVPDERITWTFGYEGMQGDPGVETVVFSETDGVTTLTATAFFDSADLRDAMLASGMVEGATETYERLDELLAERVARA